MIYITAIHLAGGTGHEHISEHMWLDPSDGKSGKTSTEAMVKFIDEKKTPVQVAGPTGPATVGVVRPSGGKPYLRTYADKTWNDNLLSLPRY